METFDEFGSGKNHYHSQNKRAHDAPKQNAMLILSGYFEVGENKQEYE